MTTPKKNRAAREGGPMPPAARRPVTSSRPCRPWPPPASRLGIRRGLRALGIGCAAAAAGAPAGGAPATGSAAAAAAASSVGWSTSSARAWCTETIGESRPCESSGISTPSGSLRSDRCSRSLMFIADTSTSRNSGRSFGRQLTSTSLRRCETTPPALTPGDRAVALEVQRDRDADLLVLEHALQVDVQDGVAAPDDAARPSGSRPGSRRRP